VPPPFFPHIRESRAYRRTYTDVGYEGFFNREIIGESVKPPRSLAVIPFFYCFLLDKPGAHAERKYGACIDLRPKENVLEKKIKKRKASNEYKFWYYKELCLTP
jgi:hypothetical protein